MTDPRMTILTQLGEALGYSVPLSADDLKATGVTFWRDHTRNMAESRSYEVRYYQTRAECTVSGLNPPEEVAAYLMMAPLIYATLERARAERAIATTETQEQA